MPLDRETEALLHWASSAPATPLWCLSPEEARNEYRRMLLKTEIAAPVIGEMSDLAVPGPNGPMRLRRYSPAKAGGTGGAILFIHGGGCVIGDIESHDVFCRTLCHDTAATVFSLEYRLAPEHQFPAAVEDSVAALEWLSQEATALGLDQERIAIAGDSAGGGLVAARRTARDQRQVGRAGAGAGADLSGARSPRPPPVAEGPRRPLSPPQDMIQWFFGHYFGLAWPIADPRAIPALYDDYTGLPPALIVTAGHDPLRDEGAEYADTLAAAGVPVDYECCEGTIHGFMNMGRVLRKAHGHTRRRLAAWLRAKLYE